MRMRSLGAKGFTLVEIVLALGVASVFLVGIVSLLSSGLLSSREAAGDTRVSLIVRDIANRIRGKEMQATDNLLGPVYYTADGEWIDPSASATPLQQAHFGVKVKAVAPNPAPSNANVLAVILEVYWPIKHSSGGPEIEAGATAKTKFTYYATTAAGSGWSVIDPSFVPKIEL